MLAAHHRKGSLGPQGQSGRQEPGARGGLGGIRRDHPEPAPSGGYKGAVFQGMMVDDVPERPEEGPQVSSSANAAEEIGQHRTIVSSVRR